MRRAPATLVAERDLTLGKARFPRVTTECRYATGELEGFPAPISGVLPDLSFARDSISLFSARLRAFHAAWLRTRLGAAILSMHAGVQVLKMTHVNIIKMHAFLGMYVCSQRF